MRVALYNRESSDDTSKAPSITEQESRGKQFAQEKGYEVVEVYSDNGYSGGDWKRPAWNQLVKDARRHLFNLVVVFSQDRIARDTEQFLWFQRNLKEAYVELYSITEGKIDLDSVGSIAQNVSLAMASHIFRKITSEKIKKTYEAKRKEAERKGVKVVWGRKQVEVDVPSLIALRKQGLGYRTIAKRVGNGISYQKVRRALQNYGVENTSENKGDCKDKGRVPE